MQGGRKPEVNLGVKYLNPLVWVSHYRLPALHGETYIVRIEWGIGGWFWKARDKASLIVPKSMTETDIRNYIQSLDAPVRNVTRIEIKPQ